LKTTLLDSSCWVEFLADGPKAGRVAPYLKRIEDLIVPSIIIYEVYKKIKLSRGEELASLAAAHLSKAAVSPLTDSIALLAADLSIEHKLAMADAVILATARSHEAQVVTLDADFSDIPGTVVL
jgi:predicted nucleic acid-binding protein